MLFVLKAYLTPEYPHNGTIKLVLINPLNSNTRFHQPTFTLYMHIEHVDFLYSLKIETLCSKKGFSAINKELIEIVQSLVREFQFFELIEFNVICTWSQ